MLKAIPGLGKLFGSNGQLDADWLKKTLGFAPQQGAYQFPWDKVVGSLASMYGANQQAKTTREMMQKAIDSDLWRGEQPKYFQPAYDAATKGIGNTAYGQSIADSTARKSASMGYNMSGNQMHDVAQGLNRGTVDYMNAIQPYATGRPGASGAIASMTPGLTGAQNSLYGAGGYGLASIFQGQQPSAAEQVFGGQPKNKQLLDFTL
jgi:hypothetical protein